MSDRIERAFHSGMLADIELMKKEIGYTPTRFTQMVAQHGGPEAVHLLLNGRDSSDGFTTLWEAGRLDMSCEAYVLLPWYSELFTDAERAVARHRLEAHGFDVDAFLIAASRNPPAWWADTQQ